MTTPNEAAHVRHLEEQVAVLRAEVDRLRWELIFLGKCCSEYRATLDFYHRQALDTPATAKENAR